MRNPDWLKKLPFFIDPKLRSFDKDLFKFITQDLETRSIGWVEELELLEVDPILPTTYLLAADTNLSLNIREADKTLLFGGANMSIFGKREFAGENRSVDAAIDWEGVAAEMDILYGEFFRQASLKLREECLKEMRSLLRTVSGMDMSRPSEAFSNLEKEILGLMTVERVKEQLPKMSKENLGKAYFIMGAGEVYGGEFSALPFRTGGDMYLCWKGDPNAEDALRLYSLLEDVLLRESKQSENEAELLDMQHILSELPIPLALFNEKQEIVLHNASFIRLGLGAKSCLSLKNDQQFSHEGELYRTHRQTLGSSHELFAFLPVGEFLGKSSSPSSEELGIISSSIAHELNNPLGGISGALDVILLDEHPEEIEQRLREMKEGVSRCKKLVETFLGFSKLRAQHGSSGDAQASVEACLSSAMELARFRLIENNISMETRFKKLSTFQADFNPHVMSMTLYLILGDLLTSFGHQKLVEGERSANFHIKFYESKKSLVFATADNLRLGKEFLESKLLNHLLDIQYLRVEFSDGAVRLVSL